MLKQTVRQICTWTCTMVFIALLAPNLKFRQDFTAQSTIWISVKPKCIALALIFTTSLSLRYHFVVWYWPLKVQWCKSALIIWQVKGIITQRVFCCLFDVYLKRYDQYFVVCHSPRSSSPWTLAGVVLAPVLHQLTLQQGIFTLSMMTITIPK